MNTTTTNTAYLVGLNAKILTCTVTHDPNGQTTDIVGRDRTFDAWCREVLVHVRSALSILGVPGGFAVTFDHKPPVNARPDLAIVAACLRAAGREIYAFTDKTLYLGEINLSGHLAPTRGVFPILDSVEGFTHAFVGKPNAIEARANTSRIMCVTLTNVHDLVDPSNHGFASNSMDLWEPHRVVVGSRGLSDATIAELTAAVRTGRNVLIVGQTSWRAAQTYHEIYGSEVRLSGSEARGVMSLHSAAGLLTDGKIPTVRPLRAPHHTVADNALVGGNWPVRPGEVSLASWGTLVLDHVLEFKRTGLSWLTNVVHEKRVTVCRSKIMVEYPAHTRIVGTVYPDELRFLTPERVAFLGEFVRVDV